MKKRLDTFTYEPPFDVKKHYEAMTYEELAEEFLLFHDTVNGSRDLPSWMHEHSVFLLHMLESKM